MSPDAADHSTIDPEWEAWLEERAQLHPDEPPPGWDDLVHAETEAWHYRLLEIPRLVREALTQGDARDGYDHYGELLDEAQVLAMPRPSWLVNRWVVAKGVTVIWGEAGTGKTLLLIDLAQRIRRGLAWFGEEVARGSVLFYEGESVDEFGPRIEAWRRRYGPENEDVCPVRYLPRAVDLTKPEVVEAVIASAWKLERDTGVPVALIIVDPLIENMTGDEIGDGMEALSRGLRAIAQVVGCAVVAGHHPNAQGSRARGKDVLKDRVHGMFKFERVVGDEVALVCEKQRSGVEFARTFAKVPVAESVVLEAVDGARPSGDYHATKKERGDRAREKASVSRVEQAGGVLLSVIQGEPGITSNKLLASCAGMGGPGKETLQTARATLVKRGDVRTEPGPNRSIKHFVSEATPGGPVGRGVPGA